MDRLNTYPPAQVTLLLMRVTKVTLCLIGAAQRTCQANGKWDGVASDCGELMLKNVKFLYTR